VFICVSSVAKKILHWLCLFLATVNGVAQDLNSVRPVAAAPEYCDDRILIQPKRGIAETAFANFHAAHKAKALQTFDGIGGLQVLQLPEGASVAEFVAIYQRSGLVEFAEPDYEIHAALPPNDPKYLDGTLWGLNNAGQSGGTADADIDAPEAWDVLNSASSIVVAILDSGIRLTHEDLASNIWTNPNDGGHGFNAFAPTNAPSDDNGHGTLVAGILGGVGNNGKGTTGVAWSVQMMACKCLNSSGTGSDSDLIACIDYARTNGAKIMNASLDSAGFSQAVSNAIYSAREAGIIFVASAGNNSANVDVSTRYPACYGIDNIVSVAYTTRTDALGGFSNFGATNVDLAAPGDQIFTTYYSSDTAYDPFFTFRAGTSYAARHVSGALALMLAKFSTETHQQIIARLLSATDPLPSLSGKCTTGGRLNLRKALSPPITLTATRPSGNGSFQLRVSAGPNRTVVIETTTNLASWSSFFTNTTSVGGTFDFTDSDAASAPGRLFRAVAAP